MQVSGGGNQTCAVKLNGDVICWGNQLAASTPPAGLNLQASPVATMTSASVSPVNQQYSDETNISATVSAAGEDASTISGTVQFKVDGANIGSPQPVNNGVATLSNYVIAERAGPHVLTAEFTSNNEHFLDSVSPNGSFFVQFEDAVVVANTTNSETLITGPSGTASTTLTFDVTELQPDAAGLNAHPGDASNLTVRFNRVSSVPFSSPVPITCTSSPSGSAYNSVNTMSCSTGDLAPGTYRIIAFPGERYIVGGPFAFVVTVLAPSTTPSLTPNQQYSDLVNLSAVVSPSASSGTVQFQIDGVNAGAPVAVTAGTATLSNYQLVQSAGTHSLQAQFISNSSSYSNSSGATSFEIAPEAASIVPSNGNPASVSAMAKSSVASVTLSFTFTETQPDQAGVGSVFGNLSLLVPVVVLHPISGGNDVQLTCTNKLTGTGYKAKIASTCVNASVLIGDYEIRASAGGGYYTGSYTSTVSVLPAKGKP
jgi:hypothetical protein